MDTAVRIFTAIGLGLSIYALYVEHRASTDETYEAVCDISDQISCSKVFLSEYGKIFSYLGVVPKDSLLDLPNAFYGVIYYVLFGTVYSFSRKTAIGQLVLQLLTTFSLVLCAYLGYLLAYVLKDKCLVCFGTYICNFILFIGVLTLPSPRDTKNIEDSQSKGEGEKKKSKKKST